MVASINFPSVKLYSSGMDVLRYTSPLLENDTKRTPDEIIKLGFGSAEKITAGSADIIFENNVAQSLIQSLVAYWDSDAIDLLDAGDPALFTYDINIIVSQDASYLKEMFEKTQPDSNDVCFFLEDNSTDIFSDRTAYIKVGSDFSGNLKKLATIAAAETKDSNFPAFQTVESNGKKYTLDFTKEDIKTLIETGELSNPVTEVLIGLMQIANIQNIILAPIFTKLSEGLKWVTDKAREYVKFEDASWDPAVAGGSFTPILFGAPGAAISATDANIEKFKEGIKNGIIGKAKELSSHLSEIIKGIKKSGVFSQKFIDFIEYCLDCIIKFQEKVCEGIDELIDILKFLGEKWINAINAFYCGLWNSVVEIFLGIIDMVGLVAKALGAIGDAQAKAQKLFPEVLEMIDEMIQTIQSVDIVGKLSSVLDVVLEKVKSFNLYTLTNTITIERVAYFVGNIGGFIVELVIDAFISGGAKGVADLAKKVFGALGENIDSVLKKVGGAIFGEYEKEGLMENMLKVLSYFRNLLKKGKEEFEKLVKSFFKLLEDTAKLGEEFLEAISKTFEISKSQIKKLQDYGLNFVTYTDEGGNAICTLCRIINNA